MKITYICTNSDLAGAPIHVKGLILGLHHRVEIKAIFGEHGPIVDCLESAGVPCKVLSRMRSSISPINDLIVLLQLVKELLSYKPDIVHLHSAKAGMLGRLACIITRTPWVYTVHGWGWRGFGKIKSNLLFFIEKILSFSFNGFYIYVSKSVEDDGINKLKIDTRRSRVIFNGVDAFGYTAEPIGPLRILMAARVCKAKDHETLIRAFDCLTIPSILILCGEGTNTDEFKKLTLNWAPRRSTDIEFLGVCTDVPSLLQSVNIFSLISNFEALPISIIEAMASERAVIASDVGGVSELIQNNVNGLIVSRSGIHELIDGFTRLENVEFRKYLARNSRIRYQSAFTKTGMIMSVWEVYTHVSKTFAKG